jgi:hypothetical protein
MLDAEAQLAWNAIFQHAHRARVECRSFVRSLECWTGGVVAAHIVDPSGAASYEIALDSASSSGGVERRRFAIEDVKAWCAPPPARLRSSSSSGSAVAGLAPTPPLPVLESSPLPAPAVALTARAASEPSDPSVDASALHSASAAETLPLAATAATDSVGLEAPFRPPALQNVGQHLPDVPHSAPLVQSAAAPPALHLHPRNESTASSSPESGDGREVEAHKRRRLSGDLDSARADAASTHSSVDNAASLVAASDASSAALGLSTQSNASSSASADASEARLLVPLLSAAVQPRVRKHYLQDMDSNPSARAVDASIAAAVAPAASVAPPSAPAHHRERRCDAYADRLAVIDLTVDAAGRDHTSATATAAVPPPPLPAVASALPARWRRNPDAAAMIDVTPKPPAPPPPPPPPPPQ